jgi:iron(III) transport system permease protein
MGFPAASPWKARLSDPWFIFTVICILISITLIILPLLWILLASLKSQTETFSLDNYRQFFRHFQYLTALKNTIKVTLWATGVASAIAIPLAYLMSRYNIRGRNIILTVITMATASPPFLGAYAWIILLGRFGVFNRLILHLTGYDINWGIRGGLGVIWVIIWLVFPLIFLLAFDAFTGQDPSHKEASLSLGANQRKTFWRIEMPLAGPGIITGIFMAGLAAFSDFGTPAIIGGEFPVLPTLVYGEFVSEIGGNLSMAATVAMIMILIATVALAFQRYSLAKKIYASISAKRLTLVEPGKKLKLLMGISIITVIIVSFLPHCTLLVISFMKWQWGILTCQLTAENYLNLFRSQLGPVGVSFLLGGIATVLDFIFGIGIAYIIVRKKFRIVSSFINAMMMIPYVIPGTVLAVGFVMLFNKPPFVLTGTWLILVLAYFIRKLPFTIKSSEAALYQIHSTLEEAALICGATPLKAFQSITFKLMLGGVISGATLSFLQIMTELSATVILYRPPWVTMPIAIFQNALSSGANFGISAAMGVVLMACIYLPLYFTTVKSRNLPLSRSINSTL